MFTAEYINKGRDQKSREVDKSIFVVSRARDRVSPRDLLQAKRERPDVKHERVGWPRRATRACSLMGSSARINILGERAHAQPKDL